MDASTLIIDGNLGFAFWLAKVLDGAGHQAFPARSEADAVKLLANIEMNLQLLILVGSPADANTLVATLRGRYKDIRVLHLLEAHEAPGESMLGVDLELTKPEGKTENDQAEFLLIIERMLTSIPTTGTAGVK